MWKIMYAMGCLRSWESKKGNILHIIKREIFDLDLNHKTIDARDNIEDAILLAHEVMDSKVD